MGPHRDGLVELFSRTAPRLRELRADIHRSPSSEQSKAPRIPSPRGLCSVLVVPARLRALPALVLMIADGGAHLAHRRAPGQKSPPGLTGMLRGRGEAGPSVCSVRVADQPGQLDAVEPQDRKSVV